MKRSMEKNVIISIRGQQQFEGVDGEVVELVTDGVLSSRDNGYSLSYKESELTGLGNTRTEFQLEPHRVTLLREGEVSSQMIFEQGRRHLSLYDTGMGTLTVGVNTNRIRMHMDDCGGEIEIDYAIEIDHAVAGQNIFRIDVREAGRGPKQ